MMMRKGEVTCRTGPMGRHGEAMAEVGSKPVHIAYALPGERVRAAIAGSHGRVLEVIEASRERVAPFCPHFTSCGGCAMQHWREDAYREWKRQLVVKALVHRGIEAPVGDLIDAHGAGRRRVKLTANQRKAGFLAARSHDIVDIAHCPALVSHLASAPAIAADLGRALAPRGRGIGIWLTATDNGIDASIETNPGALAGLEQRLAGLAAHHDLARLSLAGETVIQRRAPLVRFGDVTVELPPGGFLQATAAGEAALARLVSDAATGAKRIVDLFCGAGPFALRLARSAAVAAFDFDRAAVAALDQARRKATRLKPVTARPRDLFRNPLRADEFTGMDAVVFDPPRQGAEAQCRLIARSRVPLVIAVSCEPASLARDLAILRQGGYSVNEVTPVDQFKWTAHVEAVAVLRRR